MKIIKLSELFQNINSDYEISTEVQKKLMNGNAQFIIDLATNLEMNSYSTVSQAIYLCNYFFHHKCYLHYDRFIIAAASLLLAQKIKDSDPRLRKLAQNFLKLMQNFEASRMANDALMNSVQNKLCIAESRILKVIEYEFDIRLPNDYIEVICKKCTPKKYEEATFHTLKILILDSYRTYAPLVFHHWVILVGCFLMASSQFSYIPYTHPPESLNMTTIKGQSEEENYPLWLERVEAELREFDKHNGKSQEKPGAVLKQEDIKEFLFTFNEMLFLNANETRVPS